MISEGKQGLFTSFGHWHASDSCRCFRIVCNNCIDVFAFSIAPKRSLSMLIMLSPKSISCHCNPILLISSILDRILIGRKGTIRLQIPFCEIQKPIGLLQIVVSDRFLLLNHSWKLNKLVGFSFYIS